MIGLKWHSARLTLAAAVKFAQIKFLRHKDDSFVAWHSKYKTEGKKGGKDWHTPVHPCTNVHMWTYLQYADADADADALAQH